MRTDEVLADKMVLITGKGEYINFELIQMSRAGFSVDLPKFWFVNAL